MKPTGRLEDWVYDNLFNCIWGFVYEDIHGRFKEGTWIHTSSLKQTREATKKIPLKEGDFVSTLNSVYLLGKPKEEKNV
ncbi:MAG TPA: hypothetical protein PLS50_00070 [Candidatus Dojkabacteria bacterium]|nr:hypothetical protein [Candidatus Dojkabacteria bacterium]